MTTSDVQVPSATAWRAIHWGFTALFGAGAAVHTCLALFAPASYDGFADAALFGWTSAAWQQTFMAHPTPWALILAATELTIAVLLVKTPRIGYLAVIAFHLALMSFGWGFWLWCVPALGFAVPAAVHTFREGRDADS
jgi:hypothetical protein